MATDPAVICDPPAKIFVSRSEPVRFKNQLLANWREDPEIKRYERDILKHSPGLLDKKRPSKTHSSKPHEVGQLNGMKRHRSGGAREPGDGIAMEKKKKNRGSGKFKHFYLGDCLRMTEHRAGRVSRTAAERFVNVRSKF